LPTPAASRPDPKNGAEVVFCARGVCKVYAMGEVEVHALRDVDLDLFRGELVVLLGPSGSGKSTLLNILGGLDVPTSGTVRFFEHDLGAADETERTRFRREHVGFVFQFYNLIPSLTARENVALVTDIAQQPMPPDEALAWVGLSERLDHFPSQLSGGERQRVGLARALAANPPAMLMDEPFGALDPITRTKLQHELLRIQHRLRKTIIFVTHDIDEAILLGDRIAILREGGVLAQYDPPERLLAHPADEFVARFVGADHGLKLLALQRLDELELGPLDGAPRPGASGSTTLRDALSLMLTAGSRSLVVLDEEGQPRGVVTFEALTAPER